MRTIAVAMTKGGVGKTTTAVNLSDGLARQGQRVLLVDADTQGQCARALDVAADVTLTEVLLGEAGILDAVQRARPNLDLVASDHRLTRAALAIARRQENGHRVLADALAPGAERYDVVVIDASPGVDPVAVNVLACADDIIAPVALTPAALAGVFDFVRHIERVGRHNPDLCLHDVLPTFLDLRASLSTDALAQLRDAFGELVGPPIRVNVDLAESFGWGKTIFEHAPGSRGAEDYGRLVERVERRLAEVPAGRA
jgi:chromosome partitioning protein